MKIKNRNRIAKVLSISVENILKINDEEGLITKINIFLLAKYSASMTKKWIESIHGFIFYLPRKDLNLRPIG